MKLKDLLLLVAMVAAGAYFLSAGAWAMLGALVMLIVVHEFGHWFVARSLGFEVPVFSVGMGSSPRLYLGKIWGTEFQITPWLLGGYVAINPADENFRTAAAWKRAAVLVAGVVMNALTAVVIMFMLFATVGERHIEMKSLSVNDVQTQGVTIAKDAGLEKGDKFVSVGGQAIKNDTDLKNALGANKGTPVEVVVDRNGTAFTTTVTPNADGRIGVILGGEFAPRYEKMGVGQAAVKSVTVTVDATYQMGKGILMMMHIIPPPQGLPEGATDVRGVVAIVQFGAAAFQDGFYSFAMIVVMISLNLAFFNILPIPLLDGGHLLFIGIEKILGRPLAKETQERIAFFALLFLGGLFFLGLFNDVFRPMKLK